MSDIEVSYEQIKNDYIQLFDRLSRYQMFIGSVEELKLLSCRLSFLKLQMQGYESGKNSDFSLLEVNAKLIQVGLQLDVIVNKYNLEHLLESGIILPQDSELGD